MSKNSSINWRSFMNFIAYVAICCVGVALVLSKVLPFPALAGAFEKVAQILAYAVTAVSAFYYTRVKRHWAFIAVWLVAIVLIIVFMCL